MTTLTPGQRVIVSGAAGTCTGDVIAVETPASLPDLVAAPRVDRVREIMAEWDIVEVAMIRNLHRGRPVTFCALRNAAGDWRDLRDQPLSITELHGEFEIRDIAENGGPLNVDLDRAAEGRCRWCDEGNPAIRSSVSEAYVHTDTPVGRALCTQARLA